jgi:hypothetical protein
LEQGVSSLEKLLELYDRLPKEVKVFVEYILPSAILTALVDYLSNLQVQDVYMAAIINIVLIFLRQLKPRIQKMRE